MKKALTIFALLIISVVAMGQEIFMSGNPKLTEGGMNATIGLRDWFQTEGTAYDHLGRLCFIGTDSAFVKAWKEREANYKEPLVEFRGKYGNVIQRIEQDDKILTFQMLLDYEKHCYNDSTKVRTHKENVIGFCFTYDGGNCAIPKHYENIWIHKEATLKGFIQWYKGRGK